MYKKNTAWLKEIKQRKYKNAEHVGLIKKTKNKRTIYGLEAESVSSKRIEEHLDGLLVNLLGIDEGLINNHPDYFLNR